MDTVKTLRYRIKDLCGIFVSLIILIFFSSPLYAQQAQISVVSYPSGAEVYVGAKSIDRMVRYETGRYVGKTPLITTVTAYDVSMEGQNSSSANIHVDVRKQGYLSFDYIIGLGEYGMLEPGKIYKVNVNLRHR